MCKVDPLGKLKTKFNSIRDYRFVGDEKDVRSITTTTFNRKVTVGPGRRRVTVCDDD